MGSLSRTWEIMRASWTVLKKDTELLVFPALSSIAVLLVMASFAFPLFEHGGLQAGEGGRYVLMFLFYLATSFVMIFFNAALVGCALARMTGDDPTVRFGLQLAWRRLPQIFLWALATSTVGFLLRAVEDWVGAGGKIITSILGMTWSVTSYLVVPVLVHKAVGPIEAYKESVSMLKKTWGAQITGTISFSFLFVVLSLPPVALLVGMSLQSSMVTLGTARGSGECIWCCSSSCKPLFSPSSRRRCTPTHTPAKFHPALTNEALQRPSDRIDVHLRTRVEI